MAKRVRKRNKKRMRAFAVGFVALAFIIAAVLISQQKKLDAIAEEQAQLQEVIAAQNEEKGPPRVHDRVQRQRILPHTVRP